MASRICSDPTFVLSQASADQSSVDMDVASIISSFAFSLIHVVAIITIMSQVAWQVFIIFIPVIAISIWLQVYTLVFPCTHA